MFLILVEEFNKIIVKGSYYNSTDLTGFILGEGRAQQNYAEKKKRTKLSIFDFHILIVSVLQCCPLNFIPEDKDCVKRKYARQRKNEEEKKNLRTCN